MKTKITDTVEQMIQYKLDGLTNQEIALKFNCSKTAVNNYYKKIGFDYKTQTALISTQAELDQQTINNPRQKNTMKYIDFEDIIYWHNQGLTDAEVADKLGCTRSNITIRLNQAGISDRRGKQDNLSWRNKLSDSLKGKMLGDKNPNYKGHSDERKLARGLFKTLSNEMIRNSGYYCHICGKKSRVYHVHHIKPLSIIMDEFLLNVYSGNIDTCSAELLNYPPFMDKTNLIVICPECHKQIHYSDNPDLSPYRWERATTIESIEDEEVIFEEASRVESSDSKCEEPQD